jgi:hypothetical protein
MGVIMAAKNCSKCKALKDLDEFGPDKRAKDGKKSACRKCVSEGQCALYAKNPEPHRAARRQYWKDNPAKCTAMGARWRKENPSKEAAIRRRRREKIRSIPGARLHKSMSTLVRFSLHSEKNGSPWEKLVGYTVFQLMRHLEKRFHLGMTWGNYGKWQVDHKIPVAAFNFETAQDADFKKCWALKNLQPLWAADNQSKSDKVDRPFQPALLL